MTHDTEVDFRGEKCTVEFEYEGDGVISWWFENETICGGIDTTDAEQQAVYEQLWAYMLDWWAGQDDPS